MLSRWINLFSACVLATPLPFQAQADGQQEPPKSLVIAPNITHQMIKIPQGVILVKGAWSTANDSVTPLPEDGNVTNNVFSDPYFGITWALPPDWIEKYKGPPPSDTGRYVLAEIVTSDSFKGPARGSILITADDMFFTPLPVADSLELINYTRDNLQSYYKVEQSPKQFKIAGRTFAFFAYWSPAAQLHWYVLATQIRCHTVEAILSSTDTKLLDSLMQDLNTMKLPAEADWTHGDGAPVCLKNYVSDENVIERIDPIFSERRFNPIPIRIVINREGRVAHIHFLSAFPEQVKAITDALEQWKLKPYLQNGQPVEVETGIMFGYAPHPATSATKTAAPR